MSQTTVSAGGQPIGVAGQIADSGIHDIVSGFSQESSAQIPFGFGVRGGTSVDGYVNATGFSLVLPINGVNVFDFAHSRAGTQDANGNYSGDMGASGLLPKSSMQIMRKGRVLVPVEQTVFNGQRAWCRGIATGTSLNAAMVGMWNGTNLGASYHVDVTSSAVFRSNTFTSADGTTLVAVLEVDFTNKP